MNFNSIIGKLAGAKGLDMLESDDVYVRGRAILLLEASILFNNTNARSVVQSISDTKAINEYSKLVDSGTFFTKFVYHRNGCCCPVDIQKSRSYLQISIDNNELPGVLYQLSNAYSMNNKKKINEIISNHNDDIIKIKVRHEAGVAIDNSEFEKCIDFLF